MSETVNVASWWRRWWVIATAIVAVLVVVIGVVVAVNVANEAAAEAERVQASEERAEERAEERRVAAERVHAATLKEAEAATAEGEARYGESEAWGLEDDRATLRAAIDHLIETVSSDGSTVDLLRGIKAVAVATTGVGTEADAEARRAIAAAAALDAEYLKLAEELGQYVSDDGQDGREYCSYLVEQKYAPDNVITRLWGTASGIEFLQADVAGVRVYCPEYVPALDLVLNGFHDGTHIVGVEIDAGTYRTYAGVANCYYERNDGSGTILENNFASSAHNGLTVTVNDGDGLVTEGCGLWVRAS